MKLNKLFLCVLLPAMLVLSACGPENKVNPVTPPTPNGGGQEGGGGSSTNPPESGITMKVCSFNIRYSNTSDKYPDGTSAAWSARKDAVKKFIEDEKPDLIGRQEVRKDQSQWFSSTFSADYAYYDVSRDSSTGASVATAGGEGVAVMYRKDRFDLVLKDFFWLDSKPRELPVKNSDNTYGEWHSNCRRVTVYAELKDKKNNGAIVWFFPTHYDHKSDEARTKSAELMVSQMQALCKETDLKKANQVIIHVGDLNTTSDKLAPLNDNMHYARLEASGNDKYASTFNGFGDSNKIIDHIYYGGKAIKPIKYWVNKKDYGVPFLSDHYPVLFQWEYQ